MTKAQILLCIIFPPYILIWAIQKAGESSAMKSARVRQEEFDRAKPKNLPVRKEDYVDSLFRKTCSKTMDRVSFSQVRKDIYRRAKIDERKQRGPFDKNFLGPEHVQAGAKVVSEVDVILAARAFSYYGWLKDRESHETTLIRWRVDREVHTNQYNSYKFIYEDPRSSEEGKKEAKSSMDYHLQHINVPEPEFSRPGRMEERGFELSFEVLDLYTSQFYPGSQKLSYKKFRENGFTFTSPKSVTENSKSISNTDTRDSVYDASLK